MACLIFEDRVKKNIFISYGIQMCWLLAEHRIIHIKKYRLIEDILSKNHQNKSPKVIVCNNCGNVSNNSKNANNNEQSKVKESKVEESRVEESKVEESKVEESRVASVQNVAQLAITTTITTISNTFLLFQRYISMKDGNSRGRRAGRVPRHGGVPPLAIHVVARFSRSDIVTTSLSPHFLVIKNIIPPKTGFQGDAVPLAGSRGRVPCGVWGRRAAAGNLRIRSLRSLLYDSHKFIAAFRGHKK